MKRCLLCVYLLLLVASVCAVLISCSSAIPDVKAVESHFQNNYEDIQIVVDFITNLEYSSVDISSADGTMLADLETMKIEDENVNSAVKRLLGTPLAKERQYYSVYKSGNTIEFCQWSSPHDIGCGIAYSINETYTPRIQYCTELVPLSQSGWYYYVDDYNTWRIENN